MVIRNMSELYCPTGLDSKPYGGGIDVFLVRLTEYTATLNKNSSRNAVGAKELLNPRLQTLNKALYLSENSITSVGMSFKGSLH